MDFEPVEILCFTTAWSPGSDDRFRWRSWAEFLGDYSAIRVELLERQRARGLPEPFAERALRIAETERLEVLEDLAHEDIRGAEVK